MTRTIPIPKLKEREHKILILSYTFFFLLPIVIAYQWRSIVILHSIRTPKHTHSHTPKHTHSAPATNGHIAVDDMMMT